MPWLISILAALSGALVLFSCSLRPVVPALGLVVSPKQARDLSELTHFAVAVTDGVSDSLTSGNVGNRSLTCLNATGQVSFPFTQAQMTSGVPIAIAPGSHRFTILGFKNVVGQPTTVAQLFSGSGSLNAYIVAQQTVDTRTTSTVQLQSTYVSGVTTELVAACPPSQISQHTIVNVTDTVLYYNNSGGNWTQTNLSTGQSESLFVDSAGVTHIAVSTTGIFYKNNFMDDGQVEGAAAGRSGIVTTSGGTPNVLAAAASDTNEARVYTRIGPGDWTGSTVVLNSALNSFDDLQLRINASDAMMATGVTWTVVPAGQINVKPPSAGWGVAQPINSAGVTNCSFGVTRLTGVVDSAGYAHAMYVCYYNSTPSQQYLGYITNRSGLWVTKTVGLPQTVLKDVGLAIDGNDLLHAAYAIDDKGFYMTAPAATGNFGSSIVIHTADSVDNVAIGAQSASSATVLLDAVESGDRRLRAFYFVSGGFTTGTTILSSLPGVRIFPLIYDR